MMDSIYREAMMDSTDEAVDGFNGQYLYTTMARSDSLYGDI